MSEETKELSIEDEKYFREFLERFDKECEEFKEENAARMKTYEEHHEKYLKKIDERFDSIEQMIIINTKKQEEMFNRLIKKCDVLKFL